jgi:hypothetical protein
MSFQKNPPWQKNVGLANFPQQMSLQQFNQLQLQQIYQQQQPIQITQQYPASALQYPARVNAMAFQQQQQQQPQQQAAQSNQVSQQQQQQQQQQQLQQSSQSNQSKYNANLKAFSGTGKITKIQNDIGFIDDEVLFHKNVCVKGISPQVMFIFPSIFFFIEILMMKKNGRYQISSIFLQYDSQTHTHVCYVLFSPEF